MPRVLLSIEFRSLVKEGKGWLGVQTCQQIARAVLRRLKAPTDRRTLSIVLVGQSRMASLARRQGRRKATDVLAFTLDAPMLGEIFLCPAVIAKRARHWGRTPAMHARALFVHGLLHLLGYDHERKKEAVKMERLERLVMSSKSGETS